MSDLADKYPRRNRTIILLVLFGVSLACYSIFNYGGMRSPDSEIMYKTARSLADNGSFAIKNDLRWAGFGATQGRDNQFYSLFGPLQAIAAVPLVKLALLINESRWYRNRRIPVSHYIEYDLTFYIDNELPPELKPHADRFLVSYFNAVISAFGVIIFFLLIERLTQSVPASLWSAILYGFGTMVLPYSGTFFSEPLGMLLLMISLFYLVGGGSKRTGELALSGLFLGMSVSAHISAVLFAPFFLFYAVFERYRIQWGWRTRMGNGLWWCGGFSVFIALLGVYNFLRFGNFLETGRNVAEARSLGYGVFTAPWRGLEGLLWSSGKGLLWYCPLVILALVFFRYFYSRRPLLSLTLLGAIGFRLLFMASRSNWHGGFCLGPRYLLMIIPIALIPLGFFIQDLFKNRKKWPLLLITFIGIFVVSQQIYFSIGEIFTFFHTIKWAGFDRGFDIFKNSLIYFLWEISPLYHLLEAKTSPYLLGLISSNNYVLWLASLLVTTVFFIGLYFLTKRSANLL